jgi:hypothetical protein
MVYIHFAGTRVTNQRVGFWVVQKELCTVGANFQGPGLPSPFQGLSVAEEHLATPAVLPSTALYRSRWSRPTAKTPLVNFRQTRQFTQFLRDP